MPLFTLPPIDLQQVQTYIEARERFERRINRDFNDSTADNRSDLLSRVRLGATFNLSSTWSGEVQYQYAHEMAWTNARNFSTDHSDVSLGYLRNRVKGNTLTVGRQKIALGNQRLIGPLEWSNVARSMDAVRFQNPNWDVWAGTFGVAYPRPRDVKLGGASYKSRLGTTSIIQKLDDTAAGDVSITTLDHLATHSIGKILVDWEGAIQAGDVGSRRQEAWAVHARATYTGGPVSPYLEVNAASGGSNADKVRTFDNLYPTNHLFYGSMDLQAWKNMNEIVLGADYKPRPDVTLRASWRKFSLRDPRDAWYGAGGGPNRYGGGAFIDPTGQSGTDTGSEWDLEGVWNAGKMWTVAAGVAAFDPGSFVRRVSGSADRQVWGFVQAQYRF